MRKVEKIESLERLARKGIKAAVVLGDHGNWTPFVRMHENLLDAIMRVQKLALRRAQVLHRQGKDPLDENDLKQWLR